jgi:hypothetical protein
MIQLHKELPDMYKDIGVDRCRALYTGDVKQRPEKDRRIINLMLLLRLNAQSSLLKLVHEISGHKDCLKLMEETITVH